MGKGLLLSRLSLLFDSSKVVFDVNVCSHNVEYTGCNQKIRGI